MSATFGPAGNCDRFKAEGYKKTIQAMKWLTSLGLDSYEYQCGNGVTAGIPTLTEIGTEAKKYGVHMSLHAPYYISLSGVVPEKRLKSIDYITQSVEAANALGAKTIVIHTGSASKITRAEAMDLARDTLWKTLERVPCPEISLGLETMGKENQLGTLEEVLELCTLDKRLCPVIDFGHLNARNVGGLFVTTDDYRRVFNLIAEKLGDGYANLLHCHFSKIAYTEKGEKNHLTFEDTVFGPPFEPLMEAIVREGVSPNIICESAGTQADDALAMKNYYTSIN